MWGLVEESVRLGSWRAWGQQIRFSGCDIMIYNKKYRFGLHPSHPPLPASGAGLVKPLKFPKWRKLQSCLLLQCWGDFWTAPKEEWGLKVGTFSPPSLTSQEEGLKVDSITNSQWFNQSCLYNEASIKSQKDRVQRASELVDTWRCWEVLCWEKSLQLCTPSPFFALCISSIWLFLGLQ